MTSIKDTISKLEDLEDQLETVDRPVKSGLDAVRRDAIWHLRRPDPYSNIVTRRIVHGLLGPHDNPDGSISIESTAPWSGYLEWGTGSRQQQHPAHMRYNVFRKYKAPAFGNTLIDAIKRWMVMKGVQPESGSFEQSAENIAWSISNIGEGETGTRAHPFFYPALLKNEQKIRGNVRRHMNDW